MSEEGFKILGKEEVAKNNDLELIQQELAEVKVSEEEAILNRRRSILGKLSQDLANGIPVKITEEIKELGLLETVSKMIWTAESKRKLTDLLNRGDDDDYYDDDPSLIFPRNRRLI